MLSIKHKLSNPTPIIFYNICDKYEAEMQKKLLKDHITRVCGGKYTSKREKHDTSGDPK